MAQKVFFQPSDVRVLIVEDVPVNQVVIGVQLENRGYKIATVSNGAEAVEILRREKFDLVLMDVQMPVMNGIEATLVIRNELDLDHDALPIIAITAHALPVELRQCLEAGMDDTLQKPIITDALYDKLDEWLGMGDDPFMFTASEAAQAQAADPGVLLDERQLGDFIDFVGPDLASDVHSAFVEDCQAKLSRFRQQNALTASELHALSAMAGNLGLNRLTGICKALMDQIKAGPLPDPGMAIAMLEADLCASLAAFERYMAKAHLPS